MVPCSSEKPSPWINIFWCSPIQKLKVLVFTIYFQKIHLLPKTSWTLGSTKWLLRCRKAWILHLSQIYSYTRLSSWSIAHQQNFFVQPGEFQGSIDRHPDLSCWLRSPEVKSSNTWVLWSTCAIAEAGAVVLWFSRWHVVHLLTNESQSILQNVYPWAESRTPARRWNVLAIQCERHFALVVKRGSEEQKFPNWNCRGKFSAIECNYPNWNMARILELIVPSALAKSAIGSLMTASGQQASHHISRMHIKQIRSVGISVFRITQIFLDGLWPQPSGSGGNLVKQRGRRHKS